MPLLLTLLLSLAYGQRIERLADRPVQEKPSFSHRNEISEVRFKPQRCFSRSLPITNVYPKVWFRPSFSQIDGKVVSYREQITKDTDVERVEVFYPPSRPKVNYTAESLPATYLKMQAASPNVPLPFVPQQYWWAQ